MNNRAKRVIFIIVLVACATDYIAAPLALVLGFALTNILGHPFPDLNKKATSLLLKSSVVGLGFGMNIHSAIAVGADGLLLTVSTISLVLILGYLLGLLLGIPKRLSHLTASGTAICGGSAIAAVAPATGASEDETSVSLGVIFLLNSVALLIFPPLGRYFGLNDTEFGMWCAMAIHDTSSVVGAASAFSEQALMVATTVKLARALWIIPVSILSAMLFSGGGRKISIPWFILYFVLAMCANSYIPFLGAIGEHIFHISKVLLVVTLFLIGSSLTFKSLKEVGFKPLLLGLILWGVVSIFSLWFIQNMI
ncbi:MAG: putative sulfate exporter family transporter [Rikenellaceae bacterium]